MPNAHGMLVAPQRVCLQRRQRLQRVLRRLEAEGRENGFNVAYAMYDPLWEYEMRRGEEAMKQTSTYQRVECAVAFWSFLYQASLSLHRGVSRSARLVGLGGEA